MVCLGLFVVGFEVIGVCMSISIGVSKEDAENSYPLVDVERKVSVLPLSEYLGSIRGAVLSSDGRYLATFDTGNRLRIFDANGVVVWELEHSCMVLSLVFLEGQDALVFGDFSGKVHIWHFRGLRKLLCSMPRMVLSLASSPCGKLLSAGDGAGHVFVVDAVSGAVVKKFSRLKSAVKGICFSSDGRLVTCDMDGLVLVYDLKGFTLLHKLKLEGDSWVEARGCSVSPNGEVFAVGCSDGSIKLFDMKSGALVTILSGHKGVVSTVTFSSCGRYLFSSGFDGAVFFWDVLNKKVAGGFRSGSNTLRQFHEAYGYMVVSEVGVLLTARVLWFPFVKG